MGAVVINPEQFAQYVAKLGESFMPAVVRGVQVAVEHRCRDIMIRRTSSAPPASEGGSVGAVNYGIYKAAWKAIPLPFGAIITNSMGYSAVIEFGRRPANVNRAGRVSLTRWAQRKLHLSPDEAKAAAFAIAQTLKDRPLRPRRVMTDGIDEMTQAVLDEVTHELDVELRR